MPRTIALLSVLIAASACSGGNKGPVQPPDDTKSKDGLAKASEATRPIGFFQVLISDSERVIVADAISPDWMTGAPATVTDTDEDFYLIAERPLIGAKLPAELSALVGGTISTFDRDAKPCRRRVSPNFVAIRIVTELEDRDPAALAAEVDWAGDYVLVAATLKDAPDDASSCAGAEPEAAAVGDQPNLYPVFELGREFEGNKLAADAVAQWRAGESWRSAQREFEERGDANGRKPGERWDRDEPPAMTLVGTAERGVLVVDNYVGLGGAPFRGWALSIFIVEGERLSREVAVAMGRSINVHAAMDTNRDGLPELLGTAPESDASVFFVSGPSGYEVVGAPTIETIR